MAVHNVGGKRVVVGARDQNLFFYRSQGISIKVNPRRRWYCLWLCSSTDDIDAISANITLSGLDNASASGSCTDCGSLNVMGPKYWGFNVGQAFQRVQYEGQVRINAQNHGIAGTELF